MRGRTGAVWHVTGRGARRLLALAAVVGLAACYQPRRIPLPAPVALTRGGTPVPGKGVGIGLQLENGLQGQELVRKELLGGDFLIGALDRLNIGLSAYGGHEEEDPAGYLVTGKLRLLGPFGRRSSTALHVGLSNIHRRDGDAQDESLATVDLALPTELLVGTFGERSAFSVYAGPRFLHESYRDDLQPSDGFYGWVPAGLAGLHLQLGWFHLFGEETLAFRPETSYRGVEYPGGTIFLPSVGLVAHVGSPFPWRD